MPDLSRHFSHAATVVPVDDMNRSLAFYRDQLGFKVSFTWEEPISYAILKGSENVQIHLSLRNTTVGMEAKPGRMIYLFVHDIDGLYQIYQKREVNIKTPLREQDYKMRDFDVEDPDGHLITFGAG